MNRSWVISTWTTWRNNNRVKTNTGCTAVSFFRQLNCNDIFTYEKNTWQCANSTTSYYGGHSCNTRVEVGYESSHSISYSITSW